MNKHTLRQYLVPLVMVALSIVILVIGLVTLRQERNSQASPTATAPTNQPTTPQSQLPLSDLPRYQYQAGEAYLIVEFLDDDLVHFEASARAPAPEPARLLYTSPMVFKTDYIGPSSLVTDEAGVMETSALKVAVDASSLCVSISDTTRQPELLLTTFCPLDLTKETMQLTLTATGVQNAYGLGADFRDPGAEEVDWMGERREPGNEYGNAMTGFLGGGTGNAQFPILYALGEDTANYAVFLDSAYAQRWDLTASPWKVRLGGEAMRWYVLSGPDLPDLYQDYMELVGHSLVPPKKAFGLWVSEYGYDNWGELEDKLRTLRQNHFPLDGFVMDLQWFGGIAEDETTHMGYVSWDTATFPDPAGKIADLRDQQGLGLILIEESYIGKRTPDYASLETEGYLVQRCEGCPPVTLFAWWGFGGMLDWSNPEAGAYWHDLRRQPLVDMGITGHWTDLGEPEMYQDTGWYAASPHTQEAVHNLYNFYWSESIARGYQSNQETQRPFMLSRSGTSGIQRFGTVMWSGDIGSNLPSLAAHLNVQMHMALSGMDYYSADIGGFHRATAGENIDQIYTTWFANGALLDVPIRPHTENLCNCKETAPDRVGDVESNLANIRLRYALTPYLYSLAHRAYLYAEPVMPPLLFYYQDDPTVRQIADEKLLGRDLLVATMSEMDATTRQVYLPAGGWYDYYTNQRLEGSQWLSEAPAVQDGLFRLPLFARAGAILPLMYVDDQTMNVLGMRLDGSQHDELILRVFPDPQPSSFTLYEDDGATTAYQVGAVRSTLLSQQWQRGQVTVTIAAASGNYAGDISSRANVVQLILPAGQVVSVSLNGVDLPACATQTEFDAADSGWYDAGNGLVLAKSGEMDVTAEKVFVFSTGE
ncbi:MAG TPA: glycoside hydrolase family 31 protein [Anaerolineales bacterium]|nr:glycoside hydrolase family 31 protein [Anaerolineales bacterium]